MLKTFRNSRQNCLKNMNFRMSTCTMTYLEIQNDWIVIFRIIYEYSYFPKIKKKRERVVQRTTYNATQRRSTLLTLTLTILTATASDFSASAFTPFSESEGQD